MQKRAAFGDQGSKDGDGGFGQSTPDDKPHRATAAQLASRKIKDVRKRRAPTPTAGGGADAAPFNPFASATPAPAPAPQSTGFSFGQTQNQSQSFPGASTGAGQGGMFSSGNNGQAGGQPSFSFGGGPTSFGSQPASNPFAVNTSFGGDSQASTNGFSFGGFNSGGTGNQSAPTPAPSFGGFGAQQNTSTPSSSGLFGQSTSHITSPADDSMQTSPDTKPKGGSMFASKPAVGGSPLANPFSSLSGQAANNPFAPKPAATEESAKPAESQPFKPLFGAAAASKPDEVKTQPAASNPFANLSGQNLFAPKTTAEETPAKPAEAAQPLGGLFGSSTTSKPAEPVKNLFAPKPAAEAPTASNPFASLSTPKVTGTEQDAGKAAEPKPFASLFGTPAPSKTAGDEAKPSATPAFGNMFATPKPPTEDAASKASAESQLAKSLFGTPATSKPAEAGKESSSSPAFGNMFATPKPATENGVFKPAESQPFKPMFGAPVTSKPAEAENEKTPAPAKAQPFGSLFGASPAPAKSGEETSAPAPSNPFANLSGQNTSSSPFGTKSAGQTGGQAQPSASLFGSNITSKSANEPVQSVESNDVSVNHSSAIGTAQPSATPRAPSSKVPSEDATSCLPPSSSSSSSFSSSLPPHLSYPKSAVYSSDFANTRSVKEADSLIPTYSPPASIEFPSEIEYQSDDSEMPHGLKSLVPPPHPGCNGPAGAAYRKLVMLTESFKRQIAKCNPEVDNPDEIIILYAEIRRELGIPIGTIDPREEEKRAFITDEAASLRAQCASQPEPARSTTPPTFSPPVIYPGLKEKETGASDTVNKFKQSFASPSGPAPPAQAPVASPTPAAAPTNAIATPAAIAAESAGATSAAPASAVPKFGGDVSGGASSAPAFSIPKFGSDVSGAASPAPAFSIPKFGGAATAGTDFMSQFKAKADKSEAEAKAKRKLEDFDSDEDDEAEWERKDAEEQRQKRAKLEAAATQRSVFVPGEGFKFVDAAATSTTEAPKAPSPAPSAEPTPSAPAPSSSLFGAGSSKSFPPASNPFGAKPSVFGNSASSTSSVFGTSQPVPSSQNIFGGLQPSPKRKSVDEGSDDEDSSPVKKNKASSSSQPFSFSAAYDAPLPPDSPLVLSDGSQTPAQTSSAQNNKSSSSSQPFSFSAAYDAPLPPDSPLALSDGTQTPAQTSPAKKNKASSGAGSLLDRVSATSSPSSQPFSFSAAYDAPLPPDSPLASSGGAQTPPTINPFNKNAPNDAPSAPSNGVATTEDGEGEPGEVFDLTKSNVGEEDEIVMFEQRARTFLLDNGAWISRGIGNLRLLKHPETGRSRMVIRGDPSGNVIMNTLLKKELDYTLTSGSVQFVVPNENGSLSQYAVRVKKDYLNDFFTKVEEIKY